MDHKQILTDLKNKVYHPVYFLSGEEPYYIDIVADYIEDNILDAGEKEFNQTIVYGKETDMITIISEAKRYPMMSNHNVVIVKEAQHLEKEIDKLEAYLEQPTPSTILVFCYKYKTLDGRKSVTKKIKKQAVLLESKKLYDNQVPDWINGYLKSKKYTISPHASALIAEFLGTDLSKVANELNKLIINVPPGTEITPELVEKNIGISKDYNSFELNKAIGTKDVLKANKIVYHFAKNQKDNPLPMTIGILYSFFTNILNYHYAKDKSRNNIASLLRINPFFVQEYQVAAKNYNIKKAVKVIEYLRDYDLKSKGVNNTSATPGDLLKELVFKIIH
ncbi:DNA polymerase III subunit delta [Vicingus serpentipes]|jgi:DNA polymerase III subunit delta|uniref:DNA polymerase III subunit delta n=1 Tax=Vicingus serpentipes TaxID=1926625 RepID=A0A5C6RZ17_9FLAO|nr:DNA polymerase III subunit delta [Vicingus serpentipes]TXB66612.1 DNA polymerase III subunit delta [Vicingus serpentipes]